MVRTFFKLLRMINNDIPTEWEAAYCFQRLQKNNDNGISDRIEEMMAQYIDGYDIPQIAVFHGVTYERVRQCLIKACKAGYDI